MTLKATFSFALMLLVSNQIAFAIGETEITDRYVKVYNAPNTNAKCIGLGKKGEKFQILSETAQWYGIWFKNLPGWIPKSQSRDYEPCTVPVSNHVASTVNQIDVTEDHLKVYSAPSTNAKCIGLGKKGESFQVLYETAQWYSVWFKTSPGWILKSKSGNYDPNAVLPQLSKLTADPSSHDGVKASAFINNSNLESNTHKHSVRQRVLHDSKWFARHSFHNATPPSNLPHGNESLKYFKVTTTAHVYRHIDPKAPAVGTIQRGKRFKVIDEEKSWCKIAINGAAVWVQKKNGRVELTNDPGVDTDWVKMVMYGTIILMIINLIIVIAARFRKPGISKMTEKELTKMNVLIVSRDNKEIELKLTDSKTTLDRCFSELGFHVKTAQDLFTVRKVLGEKSLPDILFIDWLFEENIIARFEQLFKSISDVSKIAVFVFNHPDPSYTYQGSFFKTITFLGTAFSDRDIFKLVTPIITSAKSDKDIQISVRSSALEGEIGEVNLLDVLQYIEVGSKTGCVLIECGDPFAIIYFNQGCIIYARTQEATGRDAVFRALNLRDGKFRFLQNRVPQTVNVKLSTQEVLMEWTKALDEASAS